MLPAGGARKLRDHLPHHCMWSYAPEWFSVLLVHFFEKYSCQSMSNCQSHVMSASAAVLIRQAVVSLRGLTTVVF